MALPTAHVNSPFARIPRASSAPVAPSGDLEAAPIGVAVVDEDRVVAGGPGPAGDRGDDGGLAAEAGRRLDSALELAADDALVDEGLALPQAAAGGELGHAGRGAGAARAAVDRLLAVEDRVAGVRARVAGLAGPLDVRDAADGRVEWVDGVGHLVEAPAQLGREAQEPGGRHLLEARIAGLRLDDGVEVAAVGDVDDELAEFGAVDPDLGQGEVGGDVGDADLLDKAVPLLVFGDDAAGGGVEEEAAGFVRRHEAVLERHGDGADRPVAAHRQAARDLDK